MKTTIILYYNYKNISDPEALMKQQKELCKSLGLKGRILIAEEGINGTLEGSRESIDKYVEDLKSDERFKDTHIKYSEGNGDAFPRLSVKVKPEIVALKLGEDNFSPTETTGKYITPEELHELINSDEEFYIIDMRSDYEHAAGHFENSIMPDIGNFRELPNKIPELTHLKDKKVVSVCTGGVKCEKGSGLLIKSGFTNVYQLHGGIVSYMEKYPNQDFIGDLYVFDGRVTMAFNKDSPDYKVIGKCELCGTTSNNYVNCKHDPCHKHFICCENCLDENGEAMCSRVENHQVVDINL